MHIFCDESGGADPCSEVFLVAAVRIDEGSARRMLKSFRKAARLKGRDEIKGHRLGEKERRLFFDVYRELSTAAVSVVCARKDQLGGWALSELRESSIWQAMVCESVMHLCAGTDMSKVDMTVTPDGGRYSKEESARLARALECEIVERLGVRRVTVECADSQSVVGIQIADVICNTVLRTQRSTRTDASSLEIVKALEAEGRLLIERIALKGARPDWVV